RPPSHDTPMYPTSMARMQRAIAISVVGIAVAGLLSAQLITRTTLALTGVYVVLAIVVLALALVAAKATRWPLACTVTVTWLAAFAWFEGLGALAVLAGLVAAALAVGSLFRVGRRSAALAIACGVVVLGATTGWLLTLPIHYAPA